MFIDNYIVESSENMTCNTKAGVAFSGGRGMGFSLRGCKYCGASTMTLEKEDPRPKNEDPQSSFL